MLIRIDRTSDSTDRGTGFALFSMAMAAGQARHSDPAPSSEIRRARHDADIVGRLVATLAPGWFL